MRGVEVEGLLAVSIHRGGGVGIDIEGGVGIDIVTT